MKKKKLYFHELIIKFVNLGIIKEARVRDCATGIRGTMYTFDKLPDEVVAYCLQWQNVKLVRVQSQYAPELVSRGIIIYDKCIKKEEERSFQL